MDLTKTIQIGASIGFLSGVLLTGCNVITPDLTRGPDGGGPQRDAPEDDIDAAPPIDAPIDAEELPPDAYEPFVGNLTSNPDFEVDTAGWTTNGGPVTIALSGTQAHGGAGSLAVTTRSASWQGAAAELTSVIRLGHRYTATAFVRMDVGIDDMKISTRHTCIENGQGFNTNNTAPSVSATDADWVQATASFTTVGAANCTLTNFIIYVEGGGTGSFYVDDVEILEVP